jgi:ankyrin repeat protein
VKKVDLALIQAIKQNNEKLVEELLKNGADPNAYIQVASNSYYFFDVAPLLSFQVHHGSYRGKDRDCLVDVVPLLAAIEIDNEKIVELLIRYKANVNVRIEKSRLLIIYTFISSIDGEPYRRYFYRSVSLTPLIAAIWKENRNIVKLLIDNNADVNVGINQNKGIDEIAPLFLAAYIGDVEIVKYLIEKKADLNKATSLSGLMSWLYGNYETLDYDPNKKVSENVRSIHVARDWNIVKLLIENGVSVNSETKENSQDNCYFYIGNGITPLFAAIKCGNSEMTKYLLERGAVFEVKNGNRSYYELLKNRPSTGEIGEIKMVLVTQALLLFQKNRKSGLATIEAALNDEYLDIEKKDFIFEEIRRILGIPHLK